ncbi:MAG: hypothetical protein IT529_02480 [Burkholderiales bacterium]|nr:hypothetical protein [Burkholderiales bacterium]
MAIHQIQIRADEQEDRLLMRLSTTDGAEFRFWLTRRFVKQLWDMLLQMVAWDAAVAQQFDASLRRTVLEIQHEGYSRQGDFSRGFEEAPRNFPLGEAPVLLTGGKGARRGEDLYVLSLYPARGQGLDITLDTRLLHIFGKLLRDAAASADWAIDLAIARAPAQAAAAAAAGPGRFN